MILRAVLVIKDTFQNVIQNSTVVILKIHGASYSSEKLLLVAGILQNWSDYQLLLDGLRQRR